MTVAHIFASIGLIPPIEWYHDPLKCNGCGETVAILLAKNDRIVPKEWRYSPYIKSKNKNETIAMMLARKKKSIPKEWIHNSSMIDKYK